MTNDDRLIFEQYTTNEATRREFLKTAAGAIAGSIAPIDVSRAVSASPAVPSAVYDITMLASDKDSLFEILERMFYMNGREVSVEKLDALVSTVSVDLMNGKLPRNKHILKSLLADMPDIGKRIEDSLISNLQGKIDTTCTIDYIESMFENGDDSWDDIMDLLPPGDIVCNGKVLLSRARAVQQQIFSTPERFAAALDHASDSITQMSDMFKAQDHRHAVKDAEKSIEDRLLI